MRRIRTSIAAWSAIGAIVSFWAIQAMIPLDKMAEISSSLVLGIAFAVLLRWSKDFIYAMRDGNTGADFLIIGVYSMACMIFLQRIWVIALRIYDRPDWLVNTPISSFIAWMMAWSVALALVAPDAQNGQISNRSRILIGVALFVAGLVSGVSIAASLG